MSSASTAYDPFNRDEERELERLAAGREEHQLWSLEQARLGKSAAQRETDATWIKRAPLPPLDPPQNIQPQRAQELAAWAQSPGS
jgi:hypothetical protein